MKVVTLDQSRFDAACRKLWTDAARAGQPDVIVGIRTGGFVLAETMARFAPPSVSVLPITRRRPSTAAKQANPWIGRVMRALPYTITDALRLVEHRLISGPKARRKAAEAAGSTAPFDPDPVENAALVTALARMPAADILVVDDAVDTGTTLRLVLAHIRAVAPAARVRSAAIVTTTSSPVVTPDVCLYTNILCRFPWSYDFSG